MGSPDHTTREPRRRFKVTLSWECDSLTHAPAATGGSMRHIIVIDRD
jgi:hypothetical protein